jgi:acetyl esterase/lipase
MLRPRRRSGRLPAIVHTHGGGWRTGTYKMPSEMVILAEQGFVVVSVEYRLLPEAAAPAQIHDCKAAVRWLRAHADEYGVDEARSGAIGQSAGGRLAALLGLSGGVPELEGEGGWESYSSRVQAVVAQSGAFDPVLKNTWSDSLYRFIFRNMKGVGYLGSIDYDEFRSMADPAAHNPEDAEDVLRLINPMTHIRACAPPFLIMHGEVDMNVPIYQSLLLTDVLKRVGAEATFIPLKDTAHNIGKTIYGDENTQLWPVVLDFFTRHLI